MFMGRGRHRQKNEKIGLLLKSSSMTKIGLSFLQTTIKWSILTSGRISRSQTFNIPPLVAVMSIHWTASSLSFHQP